jgi:hypothetical protein
MSRQDKLLERLRDPQRDASWDFTELCQLLQRLGFEMRIAGSHHFFRKPGVTQAINSESFRELTCNPATERRRIIRFAKRARCFKAISSYE